jgi:hypothetical protein
VAEEHIGRDRSFEKLQGVTQWHNPGAHPGYFIFQGDELAVIYVDDETAMTELSLAQIQRDLGPPEAELRSRAGKAVPLYVSASKGVAYAADDEGVYYVQIFAPTTAEDYQSRIYEEVGPYRK